MTTTTSTPATLSLSTLASTSKKRLDKSGLDLIEKVVNLGALLGLVSDALKENRALPSLSPEVENLLGRDNVLIYSQAQRTQEQIAALVASEAEFSQGVARARVAPPATAPSSAPKAKASPSPKAKSSEGASSADLIAKAVQTAEAGVVDLTVGVFAWNFYSARGMAEAIGTRDLDAVKLARLKTALKAATNRDAVITAARKAGLRVVVPASES